jgi:hypothetical protein
LGHNRQPLRRHSTGDHPGVACRVSRIDFKREFTARLIDQASRKPTCPAAEMIATGIPEEIARAPFDS